MGKRVRKLTAESLKKINNTYLISSVIKLAIKSKLFTKVVVTTDCKKIAKIAKDNNTDKTMILINVIRTMIIRINENDQIN